MTAPGLLEQVRRVAPDLVVADIRMPPTHTTEGLQAARVIREEAPETAIVILSAYADVEHAMGLLASGRAIGYLLKSRITDVEDFLGTLERVARGGAVVDPAVVQELVTARRRVDPLAVLSAREREVVALMAEGRSNAGIARRLWVTERHRGETRPRHPHQAEPARGRRRPPPRPRCHHLPRGPLSAGASVLPAASDRVPAGACCS